MSGRYIQGVKGRSSTSPSNYECGKVCGRSLLFFGWEDGLLISIAATVEILLLLARVLVFPIVVLCQLGNPCPLLLTAREGRSPTTRDSMLKCSSLTIGRNLLAYGRSNISSEYRYGRQVSFAFRGRSPLRTTVRTRLPTSHGKHQLLPAIDTHHSRQYSRGSWTTTDGTAC